MNTKFIACEIAKTALWLGVISFVTTAVAASVEAVVS